MEQMIELANEHSQLSDDIQSEVKKLHDAQLSNGGDNKHNTAELVELLGGIDTILSNYLCKTNDLSLNESQLKQIKQYIQNNNEKGTVSMESNQGFCYTFYDSDKFIMSIFSKSTASKISNILHSWYIITIAVLITLCWFLSSMIFGEYNFITNIVSTIGSLLWILLLIFWSLEINKIGLILVIKSFDFWAKMGYLISFRLFATIREYHDDENFNMSLRLSAEVCMFFTFFIIASFDALNISKISKISISVSIAVLCVIQWILAQFVRAESSDYHISFKTFNTITSISCLSQVANATGILAIFVSKQALYTFYFKNRCVSVVYSPLIEWKKERQIQPDKQVVDETDDLSEKP